MGNFQLKLCGLFLHLLDEIHSWTRVIRSLSEYVCAVDPGGKPADWVQLTHRFPFNGTAAEEQLKWASL